MSVYRLASQGDIYEFFDAVSSHGSLSSSDESEDELEGKTIAENISDMRNLKNGSSPSIKALSSKPLSTLSTGSDAEGKIDFETEKFSSLFISKPTNESSPTLTTLSPMPHSLNSNQDTKKNRENFVKKDSLRDLLSKPGGKLTSTTEVDPIDPPLPSPSPEANKTKSPTIRSIKRHIKKQISFGDRSNQSSPSNSIRSNVSQFSRTSSPTSNDRFNSDSSLTMKPNVLQSRRTSTPPALKYREEILLLGQNSPNKAEKKEYSTKHINAFEIDRSDENSGIEKNSSDQSSEDEDTSSSAFSGLQSSEKKINLSVDTNPMHCDDSVPNEEDKLSNSTMKSDLSGPTQKYKLKSPFGRLKKRIEKVEKSTKKKSKLPPKTPMKKDHKTSNIPTNSVPVKSSARKSVSAFKHEKRKDFINFNTMLMIQTLINTHEGAIWCSAFSPDGKYFATGGEDFDIKIWETARKGKSNDRTNMEAESHGIKEETTTSEVNFDTERNEDLHCPSLVGSSYPVGTEIQIFASEPMQTLTSHAGDIVDLSWSMSRESKYFLLSASLDNTVKLWHVTRAQPIMTFRHSDFVTSVHFHPHDENYFLSAGFDKKIRLWYIPKERVHEWVGAPEIITQGRFSPDGKFVVAGLITGQVYFYLCSLNPDPGSTTNSTQGLRYFTQFQCKRSRSNGKKITGLAFASEVAIDRNDEQTEELNGQIMKEMSVNQSSASRKPKKIEDHLLVTTNDSRIRLYSMDDFCLKRKFKGLVNSSFMIKARFSESGTKIISGSDVGNVFIWNVNSYHKSDFSNNMSPIKGSSPRGRGSKQNVERFYEMFEAMSSKSHSTPAITDAHFVPSLQAKEAILSSGLFPTLKKLDFVSYDFNNSMVVTCDYDGSIRVFFEKDMF